MINSGMLKQVILKMECFCPIWIHILLTCYGRCSPQNRLWHIEPEYISGFLRTQFWVFLEGLLGLLGKKQWRLFDRLRYWHFCLLGHISKRTLPNLKKKVYKMAKIHLLLLSLETCRVELKFCQRSKLEGGILISAIFLSSLLNPELWS